jgi:hypothetical protein
MYEDEVSKNKSLIPSEDLQVELAEDFEDNIDELLDVLADNKQHQFLRDITDHVFSKLIKYHQPIVPYLTLEALHEFLFDDQYHL